jgi:hypothetical protein
MRLESNASTTGVYNGVAGLRLEPFTLECRGHDGSAVIANLGSGQSRPSPLRFGHAIRLPHR